MNFKVLIAASLAALISMAANASDPLPKGWMHGGGGVAELECQAFVDRNMFKAGRRSLSLRCDKDEPGFITAMQRFNAADYRGQRLRFSGLVKSNAISGWGGLWMRVDASSGHGAAFDNMQNRPIKGNTDWRRYEVVLDVASDAQLISFGVLQSGSGQMWLDDIKIETVDTSVSATDGGVPAKPQNLSLD